MPRRILNRTHPAGFGLAAALLMQLPSGLAIAQTQPHVHSPPLNTTLHQSAAAVAMQYQMGNSQDMAGANHCNYSVNNPPAQPQVAAGRCQPCTVAVDCADNCALGTQTWKDLHRYNFQPLAHGEYLGPVRLPATQEYRVRVGDTIRFIYITARQILSDDFKLQVGDEILISSLIDDSIKVGDLTQGRGLQIQANGMIYPPVIGEIRAAGLSIPQLRKTLEVAYKEEGGIKTPAIDVIPIKTNTLLQDIRDSVDARQGLGGQSLTGVVNPDGTLRLPKLGAVCVQGLTLDEIKREVNLRYRQVVSGLELEPVLEQEAAHFVYVFGQVGQPGRFEMTGPTSVTQALALAQGTLVSGNDRKIVIFRRGEDWRLIATRVDLRGAHDGRVPLPADEIWLRDNDLIIVPPTPIKRFDDFVDQVFVRGIYGILPFAQVGEGFNANGFQAN